MPQKSLALRLESIRGMTGNATARVHHASRHAQRTAWRIGVLMGI
jgi:hypothetical protein